MSTIFGGDSHAEDPELSHLPGQLYRKNFLVIKLTRLGMDNLPGKVPYGLTDHIMLFITKYIHKLTCLYSNGSLTKLKILLPNPRLVLFFLTRKWEVLIYY